MIYVPKIIDNYEIERQDVEGIGRHYNILLENGEKHLFPSMTTILSYKGDEEYIVNWKQSVGKKVAYAVSKIATDAGTELHLFCEYIMMREFDNAVNLAKTTKDRRAKFYMRKILPHLQKYKNVYASEEFLFSLKYKIAGTTDAVVVINNIIYILDFKTSSSIKDESKITSYYIQVAGYAIMWEEITGQKVNDAIILIVNPMNVQEIVVSLEQYRPMFLDYVDGFYKLHGHEYQKEILTIGA
jgi:CRISPR/Cas system-associated exonuclease Cas4 (RecB family)